MPSCFLCQKTTRTQHAACEHLLASVLSGWVERPGPSLRCARCARTRKKVTLEPLCKRCFEQGKLVHLPLGAADRKAGYAVVPRDLRRRTFPGPTPVSAWREGDLAKVAILSLDSPQEIELENPWFIAIREEEDGWLSGEVNNDLSLFPGVLACGDRLRFRREHLMDTSIVASPPDRTDGHACSRCDPPAGSPRVENEMSRKTIADVRRVGWSVIGVLPDADHPQPFAYTIGLHHSFQLPDFILIGMDYPGSGKALNRLVLDARARGTLSLGVALDDLFEDARAMLVELADGPELQARMTGTRWFEEGPSPCVQLVWSDRDGLFPWDEGCDEAVVGAQLVLPAQKRKANRKAMH
jgi:hypothetical protein